MKRLGGRSRRHARRLRKREDQYLRRYGYVQEWQLEMWRFKRRKEQEAAK